MGQFCNNNNGFSGGTIKVALTTVFFWWDNSVTLTVTVTLTAVYLEDHEAGDRCDQPGQQGLRSPQVAIKETLSRDFFTSLYFEGTVYIVLKYRLKGTVSRYFEPLFIR